ncbi:TPA: hypothetical protein HND14_22815 [Escherichia coli]|nr:hypothetical protein [Escherichia coli]
MTSLKTSIKTITYLSDIGCLEIHGASLGVLVSSRCLRRGRDISSLLYGIVLHTLVVVLTYHQ